MKRVASILLMAGMALAFAAPARAGAAFSCDLAFEARVKSGVIDPELRSWIVDTARRFYQDRSRILPPSMRAACAGLGCVSDDDIMSKVARQCSRTPTQTLELAVEKSLPDIIFPVIGCDARCAMSLRAQ